MTPARPANDGLRRASLIVWTAICALLLALIVAATWLVVAGRRDALERSNDAVVQTASGAQAQLNRALLSLDLQLAGLQDIVADAWRAEGALDAAAAQRAMAAFKDRQLLFNDAALIDESGRTLVASLPGSDRDGLRVPDGFRARVFAQAASELVVSETMQSPSTGEASVYLARRVALPDGRPAMAVLEVPLPLLAEIVAQSGGIPGLVTTLERDDGLVLISVSSNPDAGVRRALHDAPVDNKYGKAVPVPPRPSGEPAFVALRPSVCRELQVGVSLSMQDALLPWRDARNIIVSSTSALVLLTLVAGLLSQWQFNRLAATREALARSAVTLDQALAAMADGFLLCDSDDRVLRWNERYLELFPWLRPAIGVGVPFADLVRASLQLFAVEESDAARENWVRTRLELHRGGRDSWERDLGNGVVVHATDRRTPDGGVVSVFHDVTAAERRLEQARRSAEAANQAKSQFLATMSHEIRTPLNAVLGLNELMLNSPLDAQQRRFAELIGSSGRLLLTLINDILDVSRIEAGHVQLQVAPFSPRLAAEGVVALMQERALAKGLALRLDLAHVGDEMLLGDVIRIQQILFNLIGNAVKFTATGEVLAAMSVQTGEQRTATLRLEVSDTGIGIPAPALPRLFERFTQADSTTMRRYGGSGLGLAITHEIVQLMDGAIDTCSTPGQGSRFVVTLPLRFADAGERPLSGIEPQPGAGAPAGLSILVAEDNDVNQILIGAVLERMGHRSRIVEDGRAAVDAARRERYDLVLMDLQMPDMDGLEATQAIRALGGAAGALPIIAMTANAFEEDRQACLDAGMNDYLAKPIDLASLAQAIARNAARGGAAAH